MNEIEDATSLHLTLSFLDHFISIAIETNGGLEGWKSVRCHLLTAVEFVKISSSLFDVVLDGLVVSLLGFLRPLSNLSPCSSILINIDS